jgi:endonuclease/exonuclease/phosphatase family metal-dependent hydrolase
VIVYLSGWMPPTSTFNLWLMTFFVPFALMINIVLLLHALFKRRKTAIYYLVALCVGYPYLTATVAIRNWLPTSKIEPQLTVLSYNIGGFQARPHLGRNSDSARYALRKWILANDADIQCYQEFINIPRIRNFNIIGSLDSAGLNTYFSRGNEQNAAFSSRGTLIVTRFPIISAGDVLASTNGFNRIAYADVRIDSDTIRIINVHLESMGISTLDRPRSSIRAVGSTTRAVLRKLKAGVFERSRQVRSLVTFIEASPYPVICVGDFNELPYSYSYQYLKRRLNNSFEQAGRGFAFTYNGGTLKGLRIDNQFFTQGIRAVSCRTLYSIDMSDHFPVVASYALDP